MTREYATPLDAAMDRRRLDLRMKWREVASQAGISYEALRAARIGEGTPAPLTQSGLERALRWKPGSIAAILAGGEPTPLDEPEPAPTVAELAAELAAVKRRSEELARRNDELERRLDELEARRKPNQAAS